MKQEKESSGDIALRNTEKRRKGERE